MIKTHGSVFSGIGGAELAATWMGWENLFHCEINTFCRKVLEYWYPQSTNYEDITKTDFSAWRGKIDILTGGFPCQPFSMFGARKGTEDNRYLWPQMLRAIREIQPTWVVAENVAGLLSMVQPLAASDMERNIDTGKEDNPGVREQRYVIDEILESLEGEGYSVQPLVIPACAVGAPHRRDRVWIVANAAGVVLERWDRKEQKEQKGRKGENGAPELHITPDWSSFPTQSPVCGRNDGFSIELSGISFPKWRAEAVKALGNAWVPQVAYEIFKAIEQTDRCLQ